MTETKLISILDGNTSKIGTVLSANQNDPTKGIFIHNLIPSSPPPTLCISPCPLSDSKSVTDEDENYKYEIEYRFVDLSTVFNSNLCSNGVDYIYRRPFEVKGTFKYKDWFGYRCKKNAKSNHEWTGEAIFKHNIPGINSPFNFNLTQSFGYQCYPHKEFEFGHAYLCISPYDLPDPEICIEKFVLHAVATAVPLTLDFNCQ